MVVVMIIESQFVKLSGSQDCGKHNIFQKLKWEHERTSHEGAKVVSLPCDTPNFFTLIFSLYTFDLQSASSSSYSTYIIKL